MPVQVEGREILIKVGRRTFNKESFIKTKTVMIKPSASDIVSMIGNALFPYDYTPIGINKDKDRKGLEESIRYFILKKVQCVLARLSKENFEKKIARTPYPAYTKI